VVPMRSGEFKSGGVRFKGRAVVDGAVDFDGVEGEYVV
jgi:hypothetical protein